MTLCENMNKVTDDDFFTSPPHVLWYYFGCLSSLVHKHPILFRRIVSFLNLYIVIYELLTMYGICVLKRDIYQSSWWVLSSPDLLRPVHYLIHPRCLSSLSEFRVLETRQSQLPVQLQYCFHKDQNKKTKNFIQKKYYILKQKTILK